MQWIVWVQAVVCGEVRGQVQLVQGDEMNISNTALGPDLSVGAHNSCGILIPMFCILDLPSGETQYKGT